MPATRSHGPRGFTIIELVVTMAVAAVVTTLAAPNFAQWLANARVRSSADYIQNGLRLAQTEAVKQNRVVAFVLTTSLATSTNLATLAASNTGSYWYAAAVPFTNYGAGINNTLTLVAAGQPTTDQAAVTISGAPTICFTPYGRITTTYTDPTGFTSCAAATAYIGANNLAVYTVSPTKTFASQHPLDVTVSTSGEIRMCDPTKQLSLGYPDGC
jgi:type IV fimbrial biogenesis protein FimT